MMNQTQDYGYDMLPLDKNRKNVDEWRSIGLGVFGLADMFVAMKVKYGSKESLDIISKLFDKMNYTALDESCNEAIKFGTFGEYNWEYQKRSPIIKALRLTEDGCKLYDKIEKHGLRNSSLLSCAPTGCQKKETLVATSDGLLRLDELIDINGNKWQERGDLYATQEKHSNIITKGFINGYAHTKKIRLYSGIELESTFNHQYRIIRDGRYMWCRADELQLGDIVPSRIGYYNKQEYCKLIHPQYEDYNGISKKVIFPNILEEKLAFILGCYFANGSTKRNGGSLKYKVIRFAMNANKEDDINKLMECCYDVFGVRPRISTTKNRQTCVDMYIASVNLCNLFSVNGLIKDKSYELHVPRLIRQSPRSVIESFLDGYYMCDGSHSGNNKYIDTVSFQLAQELAVIFRALGIDIKILTYSDRSKSIGNRPLYRVCFGGRFSLGNNYIANKDRKNTLLQVKELLGEDFIFDEIVAIENSTNMTYDIEVDNEHYYLANGIISHNTISLFMGKFSGGVEPLFRCGYDRTTHSGENKGITFRVFAHSIDDLLEYSNLPKTLSNEVIKEKFPWVVESQDIAPIDRISVQSVMQEYIDNAISSTINLPEGTTAETIFDIYINAWRQELKGITVFVDNCKRGNILGVANKTDEHTFKYDSISPVSRRGEKEVDGKTFRLKTACVDKFYLHVNKTDEGDIFEVFANPSNGCTSNIGTITRLVSMALRSGVKVEEIIKELKATKCAGCQALRNKGEKDIELSCGNAIAKALELSYTKEIVQENTDGLYECPNCHQKTMRLEGKCCICSNCSFSRCE